MAVVIAGVVAAVCYSIYLWMQSRAVLRSETLATQYTLYAMVPAILAQGLCVVGLLNSPLGIDFAALNVLTLVMLTVSAFSLFVCVKENNHMLLLVVVPITAAIVLLAIVVDKKPATVDGVTPGLVGHVITSILAYSVLTVAAAQALLLTLLERWLRKGESLFVVRLMPPLESADSTIVIVLWIGVALLTVANGTGFVFLWDRIDATGYMNHMYLAIASWVVYVALLLGHIWLGWRGRTTARLSLIAFVLLLTGYFGLKLLAAF